VFAQGIATTPTNGLTGLIVLVLAASSAAALASPPGAAAALLLLLVALIPSTSDLGDWTFAALIVGGSWSAGYALRRRAAAVRLAETERDAAAATERSRIAHELHDIVSHRVTTMVVQAQAAHTRTEDRDLRDVLERIDESGRQALAELRDLLGVLHGDPSVGDRRPQPGLDQIPTLIDEARSAGLDVRLEVDGRSLEVEAGLGLTAYRIVQEALTNVVKHAGAAPARVVLRYRPSEIEIVVTDCGERIGASRRPGHGLVGMRERVAVYGGSLEAGATAGGGFSIRARLPVRTT
jgi:signal transduction histidine kinase